MAWLSLVINNYFAFSVFIIYIYCFDFLFVFVCKKTNKKNSQPQISLTPYPLCSIQQDERVSAEHNGIFATAACDAAMYLSK